MCRDRKGCEIVRCEEEEVLRKNWFDDFVPGRVKDEVVAVFDKLIAGEIESVKYFESPVLSKPSGETFITWHNTVLIDETGNIVGVLSSGEDITERQLLRKQMVEYEKLSKLKSALLSTVSHQLCSLLPVKATTCLLTKMLTSSI